MSGYDDDRAPDAIVLGAASVAPTPDDLRDIDAGVQF
jgi:hypothetical protein